MLKHYDLIVIGGGSAGLVAAGGAAILGAKVALIERDRLGGDCLYSGCVPSKTFIRSATFAYEMRNAEKYGFKSSEPEFLKDSFASIIERVQRVIGVVEKRDAPEVFEEMGVEVIFGAAKFTGPHEIVVGQKDGGSRTLKAKRFCISTGSRPFTPPIEGLEQTGYITNEDVFHIKDLPKRLVVLGGGAIGVELGQAFARFGSDVTIVEMGDRILSKEETDVSSSIERILKHEGLTILTGTKAIRAAKTESGAKSIIVESSGKEKTIEADEILAAVGRKPNIDDLELKRAGVEFDDKQINTNDLLQTSQKHIYAAGDVTGNFQFTHMADYEARIVIQNAFVPWPFKKKVDFRVVPWATFTDPEIGRVGMTEAEAREKFGDGVRVHTTQVDENDRAQASGSTDGFVKVVSHRGRIVGATIVAAHAGELIHEYVWAVKDKLKVEELNEIIRVYPTLSKLTQEVGTEATLKTLKSPFVQRWFARYLSVWRRAVGS